MSSRFKFRVWNGETMISPDYISRDGNAFWKENSIPTSSDRIEQFIGIKDRNGVEIYEGDLVSYVRERWKSGVVTWDAEGCCFMFGEDEIGTNLKDIEVYGNIHETVEPSE